MTSIRADEDTTHAPTVRPIDTGGRSSGLLALARPPRLIGVDVARALAVIGMIGAHVGITEAFDWARPDTWTDLVNGRSAILFAVVAGVSVALMTSGRGRLDGERVREVRLRLVGRGAVIFAIGMVLELLNTGIAVILPVYGLLFIVVIPFLRWRRRSLLIGAACLALVGPIVLSGLRLLSMSAYGPGLDLALFGHYPVTVWMSLMLVGVAIGRSRLDLRRTAATLLLGGAAVSAAGYGLGALVQPFVSAASSQSTAAEKVGVSPSELDFDGLICDVAPANEYTYCYAEDWATRTSAWPEYLESLTAQDPALVMLNGIALAEPHSGGIPEVLGSGGFAVAVIGLCLLLSRPLRWVLLPLAALGSMPLSVYSAQVVVIFLANAAGWVTMDNMFWLVLCAGLMIAASVWAHFLGRGPFERLTVRAAAAMASAAPPTANDRDELRTGSR